jgi:hypothetical protein
MRRTLAFILATLIAGGCATFKELKPEPELSPVERGYVELKNDKEDFELEKDGKYFIRFPAPASPNFALVLITDAKPALRTFLTSTFAEEKTPGAPIPDENAASDSIIVYAADNSVPVNFWIIDSVSRDLHLRIRYRYVPQWRYTFENRYADLQKTLAENTVDRTIYLSIDPQSDIDRVDLQGELSRVGSHLGRVTSMKDELLRLEKVFPPNLAASGDSAYRQYIALRSRTDDELTFQEDYSAILGLFKDEKTTRGDPGAFLEKAPSFTSLLSQRQRFPQGVRAKAVAMISGRLQEVAGFLDNLIRTKQDLTPIRPSPAMEVLEGLYVACDRQFPSAVESSVLFIGRFNVECAALESARAKERALAAKYHALPAQAGEAQYADLAASARGCKSALPEPQASRSERYAGVPCALMLAREIQSMGDRADDLATMYQTAASAAGAMVPGLWPRSEASLRELYDGRSVSGSAEIAAQRSSLVRRLEDQLFAAVKTSSQQRIDAFITAHQMEIDNVPALYADSAFLPVYTLTFSSQGPTEVTRRRRQIESYLEQIKYNQLPESSIKAIYASFTNDMRDRGVEKARKVLQGCGQTGEGSHHGV